MVVGNGIMGKAFGSRFSANPGIHIFASGVSNSKETSEDSYFREIDLIERNLERNKGELVVYFSTCSIYDPHEYCSRYVRHKLQVESLIRRTEKFLIARVSNVAAHTTNGNLIFNFLFQRIKNNQVFDLWSGAFRNIIDIDDVYNIVSELIEHEAHHNQIINVANPISYRVPEIVHSIENFLGKKAVYELKDVGSYFPIDCTEMLKTDAAQKIEFGNNYLSKILYKYYSGEVSDKLFNS